MTINYSVDVDKDAIAEAIGLFEFMGGNTDDALRIAINKAGPKIRTLVSRRIRNEVNLSASYLRGKLEFKKATRKDLSGVITTPSRGMLMPRYSTDSAIAGAVTGAASKPPMVPASGIKVKVKAQGAAKVFKGDALTAGNKPFFMVLRKSGAIGIVARLRETGPRGGKIRAFYGPSVSQVFNGVRQQVLPESGAELQKQLIDAMRYLMAKKYPPEATV